MKKSTTNHFSKTITRVLILSVAVWLGFFQVGNVFADSYQSQIDRLQNEVDGFQAEAGRLSQQADTLQNAVNVLNAQKSAIQAELDVTQARHDKLVADIDANQKRLEKQKRVYSERVADLSANTRISPIELLASSQSIGDFVRADAYQSSVQDQIETAIKEVKSLKLKLSKQKKQVEDVLADQTQQRNVLAEKEAEQASLLATTQGQEAAYQSLISEKNSELSSLRAAQAAANSRFVSGGNYSAGNGPACGGGYPGIWCNAPMDSLVDDWGMYNRQCVSYTAFRVAASGRHMPYWGGIGNANQWDDNARRFGIPVDTIPRAGDVAISNAGYYGHSMYVESVNPNGTINISQYNASWTGTYSTNTISPAGLYFIHF